MDNNWLWLAAGAAIGWVATQFGTLLKDVLRRYLLKRAAVSELRQVHEESRRVWTSLAADPRAGRRGQRAAAVEPGLCEPLRRGAARVHPGTADRGELIHKTASIGRSSTPKASRLPHYYATRPDFPVLEHDSPELETYQQYVDSYRDEFKNIVASVKGLTREDFERAYRPARPPEPDSGGTRDN